MTLVLRVGLLGAAGIVLAALLAYLVENSSASSSSTFASNAVIPYLHPGHLAHGLAHGSPEAYLLVGLYVLIATPIVRVLTGVYYFGRGGERAMTWVTTVVFLLLLLGLFVIGPYVH
ncbi:MAG: DUF1634 domain-containing protein [Thermoplasmata archaeon]